MAYSALLLIPGYEGLRFLPFLKKCKQEWNSSSPKYTQFWSAEKVLERLTHMPLNWCSVREVRDRFIICARLLQLTRSIDLHRCWRVLAKGSEDTWFLKIRRKGHHQAAWEQLLHVPSYPALSPMDLCFRYVQLTAHVTPGSQLLRSLKPPFAPLSANTIGSITKALLDKLGVPMGAFGPHSTRGAGVAFDKD